MGLGDGDHFPDLLGPNILGKPYGSVGPHDQPPAGKLPVLGDGCERQIGVAWQAASPVEERPLPVGLLDDLLVLLPLRVHHVEGVELQILGGDFIIEILLFEGEEVLVEPSPVHFGVQVAGVPWERIREILALLDVVIYLVQDLVDSQVVVREFVLFFGVKVCPLFRLNFFLLGLLLLAALLFRLFLCRQLDLF